MARDGKSWAELVGYSFLSNIHGIIHVRNVELVKIEEAKK